MADASPMGGTPFDPTIMADPFPAYRALRESAPVHRMTLPNGRAVWLITRYSDARSALADPRLSMNKRNATAGTWPGFRLPAALDTNLLNMDPPDQTRIRRLIAKAFTPRRVDGLRERVQQVVDEQLDLLGPAGRADMVVSVALPVALTIMCELLGVDARDRTDFRAWTAELVAFETGQPADLRTAISNIYHYLTKLIARKRAEPADDLTSALIAARDQQDKLSEDELISATWLTLFAGTENTARAIVNAILALLRNPEQLAMLRSNPGLLPTAIEELLRYDGPAQTSIRRFALEDIDIGGVTIRRGDAVMVAIACANRDPDRFAAPDALDLTRADNPHLSFGNGAHYCFGAPLARLEAQIAIGSLIDRFATLRLAVPVEELTWQPSFRSRDVQELPVVYEYQHAA
jgi:cytochrome P450